jgi:RNA pseudouridylate synthase
MVVVVSRSVRLLRAALLLTMSIRRISHSHTAGAATFTRYCCYTQHNCRCAPKVPTGWTIRQSQVVGSGKQQLQQHRAHRSIRALSTTTAISVSTENENPTLDWKGNSHSTSSFATHVLIQPDESPVTAVTVVQRVLTKLRQERGTTKAADASRVTELSASALVQLGSVWFLAAGAPRDPAAGIKPTRITTPSQLLYTGDYLRIHHDPRRFMAVHQYDWNAAAVSHSSIPLDQETMDSRTANKPGVIVDRNTEKGWLVIDKPAGVPVHMTVDNALENVAACILAASTTANAYNTSGDHDDLYVATPQRLDQNTSGLLVVATSKRFAAYFAQLLRGKTAASLEPPSRGGPGSVKGTRPNDSSATVGGGGGGGVHKLYKCLVCCLPPTSNDDHEKQTWSVQAAAKHLQSYVDNDVVMRHYLEPSIRAPKRFVDVIPDHVSEPMHSGSKSSSNQTLPATGTRLAAQWAESLLRIRRVSPVYALVGHSAAATDLAQALWASSGIPDTCRAVLELEIELLTGRTHQIRGQLAASHYPIVGDMQYGGAQAVPTTDPSSGELSNERLALQCCQLEFLDPDHDTNKDGKATLIRSNRWNRFRIDQAWWTPLLQAYDAQMAQITPDQATTSSADDAVRTTSATAKARSDLLPPRVSLSPGKHKYVLLRAEHPSAPTNTTPTNTTVEWFVKSAAPHECGGPYHGG